jgi:phosphatidylethanolamine-binding protein (PEBP) family uncharacterized protein
VSVNIATFNVLSENSERNALTLSIPPEALDFDLVLKPRATKQELLRAMDGLILAEAQLMGTYQRRK